MADITKKIGLSLGADICWPLCYEQMMGRLDLKIPYGGDTVRLDVERVMIEPFDLKQPCSYAVVIDTTYHAGYDEFRADGFALAGGPTYLDDGAAELKGSVYFPSF